MSRSEWAGVFQAQGTACTKAQSPSGAGPVPQRPPHLSGSLWPRETHSSIHRPWLSTGAGQALCWAEVTSCNQDSPSLAVN